MKLIILIPCFNEEENISKTLQSLPRKLTGLDQIEFLVVDDGSEDKTIEIARDNGADLVLSQSRHFGLARTFAYGMEAAVKRGADIVVNFDADGQYRAEDIEKIIAPILIGEADMVVGVRELSAIPHFSVLKKCLQHIGSWVVRMASGTDIPDASSGFRAITRETALQLHIFSRYSYTLETIIQAGRRGMTIGWIAIKINPPTRVSRLIHSIPRYLLHQTITIVRIFIIYRPFRFFGVLGLSTIALGVIVSTPTILAIISNQHTEKLAFLLIGLGITALGISLIFLGIIADLVAVNRQLLERIDYRTQKDNLQNMGRGN